MSSKRVAKSRYSSLRNALFQISEGNRFDLPVTYNSSVRLSANVLITSHVTLINTHLERNGITGRSPSKRLSH